MTVNIQVSVVVCTQVTGPFKPNLSPLYIISISPPPPCPIHNEKTAKQKQWKSIYYYHLSGIVGQLSVNGEASKLKSWVRGYIYCAL